MISKLIMPKMTLLLMISCIEQNIPNANFKVDVYFVAHAFFHCFADEEDKN